jgi:crotonobetainyl-CoA:carnitine CoA-transferase CaiB-like acyl-CoA transferase
MTPERYACELLHELGFETPGLASADTPNETALWAASGAQYLTGEPDGPPLSSPAPLATCALGAWRALAELSESALDARFPAHQLLSERAALQSLQRHGALSAGGACRLLDCADGQLALNLPRENDWHLLPAWLESDASSWEDIAHTLRHRSCQPAVARARLLGLAAAASGPPVRSRTWFSSHALAPTLKHPHGSPLVIDLTSLWAGPLCTQLLGQMGARVVKVESSSRPDGARAGSPQFFDLLNADKQSVALDLASPTGRRQLQALLEHADIVVESSRPRALEQMGIDASQIVRQGKGKVWLSITGYGRAAPMRDWIAYGDDVGVAAGLTWLLRESGAGTVFCADAIADPLTGLHAALLAWAAWTQGGGRLLDVSLCGVVSRCIAAGQTTAQSAPTMNSHSVSAPIARPGSGTAPALGRHTEAFLLELGISP